MKWNLFKHKLKNEARQERDAVDVDALWSAIEPDVDAINEKDKKKRRGFFFWLIFGGAVAFTAGWFALSDSEVIPGEATVGIESASGKINDSSEETVINNNLIAKSKEAGKEADLLSVNSNEIQKKETIVAVNTIKAKNEKVIENKVSNNKFVKKNQWVGLDNNANNDNKLTTTILQIDSNANSTVDAQSNSNPNSVVVPSQYAETSVGKLKTTTENESAKNAILTTEITPQLNLNSLLVTMQNGDVSIKRDSISEVFDFYSKRDYLANKGKTKFSFTAGITGGLSYANRNLSQKEGPESVLFQNRDKYESTLETSHYGVFIGARHEKSNIGLTIGLQSTNIAERYTYKKIGTESEMINGIQVRRVNLEGDTIDIMGEVLQTTTSTIDKNIHNRYRLLDIPVILSYQFPLQKWAVGIEAGILANLSLKTKGLVPNELLETPNAISRDLDIDNSETDLFKTKVGLGYHFGLSFGGKLTKHLDWRLAPMLRIYPSDFASETNTLSQRYVLYGVNGGVAYRF